LINDPSPSEKPINHSKKFWLTPNFFILPLGNKKNKERWFNTLPPPHNFPGVIDVTESVDLFISC
jgi:hypothetical protein